MDMFLTIRYALKHLEKALQVVKLIFVDAELILIMIMIIQEPI